MIIMRPFSLVLCVAGLALPIPGLGATADAGEASAAKPIRSSWRDLDGKAVSLVPPRDGFTLAVFYSTECPISNAYSSTYNALASAFPSARVGFVGICVDPDITAADVKAHARDFRLNFRLVHDRLGRIARALGATKTPEAFVIDDRGETRYHGRIDDQYAARQVRNPNPSSAPLRDAVAALLAGQDVATPFVEPVGCPIPVAVAKGAVPTYSRDVAPILYRHCLDCHRKGQVGPFALETYSQARKRAADLANVVADRLMPPWKAAHGIGGPFKDDRSLAEKDIATIVAWAENGAPEGDPADLPPKPEFSDDWSLGTPDLVVDIGADMEVPAGGEDIYRCFVRPTNLPKDVYLSAIEYRPGNRRVVHHILAYVDVSGEARKKDDAEPGPGYTCFSGPEVEIHGDLGGWAPGNLPSRLPDGIGRSLPKGADVIIQVHYHPTGKPETDRTRIGLYFSRKPVHKALQWGFALNEPDLVLPPGSTKTIRGAWQVPVDTVAYAVTPHMHLLGREIAMTAKFPDGRVRDLIKIDDWDFNWQATYYFRDPIELPKGSVINVIASYDNTSDNPRNPNKPPKLVKWGEATTDEMCIGFIALTKKHQDLTKPGEKNDLLDIIMRQRKQEYEEYQKRRAAEKRQKSADAGPGDAPR
jgi:hypothetical protein